jgi:hypothetical protein
MRDYMPLYEPTELCRKVFKALYKTFAKSGTYHNQRSCNIIGGCTYEVGSTSWHSTFPFSDEDLKYPPLKKLHDYIVSGQLKDGDILTGGEGFAPLIKGKTVEIAAKVMKEEFDMTLLDSFIIGKRAYYLWIKSPLK